MPQPLSLDSRARLDYDQPPPMESAMRRLLCISTFLAVSVLLAQPAAASCEGVGHADSTIDPTTTSCVTIDAVMAGDIAVSGAWARPMLPGQPAGSGFFTLENKGTVADRLTSVSSAAAGKVELHTMEVENDVMKMRPVEDGLEIAPGEMVELKPGGMHLMFHDVAEPFADGEIVMVTLTFERAGSVEVELPVMKAGANEPEHSGHHDHH